MDAYAFELISTATDDSGNESVESFVANMECTNGGGALSSPESSSITTNPKELSESVELEQDELVLGESSFEKLATDLTAFPNPFSDRTTIRFQLIQPEQVVVEVFEPAIIRCGLRNNCAVV